MDVGELTRLLGEAEEHHSRYEATAPPHHWSGWYAGYIVARLDGRTEDEAVAAATLGTEGARR
ncbi:bleomycin resistance protein [Geodermatophilus marinus]|nr:bleomycin resistance protein [Geodermatophilus sp. LHW52908]